MDVNGNDNTPQWGYCQVEGCHYEAIPCYLPDSDGEPDDLLCSEHCKEQGYCWGCGHLWAGCESFDFSPDGLCSNCASEYREPEIDEADIVYWWGDSMDEAYQ